MLRLAHSKMIWIPAVVMLLVVWCRPSWAISVKEEEDLAREFMKVVTRHFVLIDDPMILSYVRRVGGKISPYTGSQPFTFKFHVIKEDVYNAFAIPAGHIFINSGLLAAMDSEDELAGILAHEMAHVACRHISQRIERTSKINLATMAGVVAGIFLGAATGDAKAMQALTIGSSAAGQSAALAYSREDETQADQLGLMYLEKAGYSGRGMVTVLKKIRGKQWFGSQQIPTYMMTHPAVEQRIVQIDTDMAVRESSHAAAEPTPSPLLKKVVIRLKALYDTPDTALPYFRNEVAMHPSDAQMAYGYALVLARIGKRQEAAEHLKAALAQNALDPLILGDLGRVYFLDGQYEKALSTLSGATSSGDADPEAWFYLGRTQMELGDLKAAVASFEKLLEVYPDHIPTYQFLGECYGRLSVMPEAHFNLGIYHFRTGDMRSARYHLLKAREGMVDTAKLETINKVLKRIDRQPQDTPQK